MMREEITKAYDILKEEQRNADNKANLFIIIISAVIAFISEIPISISNQEQLEGSQYLFLLLLIPLLLFIWSLIPIYSDKYLFRIAQKNNNLNIFYWKSIFEYDTYDDFINAYKSNYGEENLAVLDKDLLSQIFTNANIMASKSYTHKIAFYILGHIIIFMLLGFIAEYLIGYNYWIVLLFVFVEILYTEYLFNPIRKIIINIKNKVKCKW